MSKANMVKQTQSGADELKSLADKFLASKGVAKSEDAAEANLPEQASTTDTKNLLIGIPAFNGQVHTSTVNLLLDLAKVLPFPHTVFFLSGESLITRGRNLISSVATFGRDGAGRKYSSLLFLDSDISFQPEYVLAMLKANLPIIALPYAKKALNWRLIAEAARHGVAPEHLVRFGGMGNIAVEKAFAIGDDPVEVRHAATGAMLIDVDVFRALAKAFPEKRYKPNCDFGNESRLDYCYDFFPTRVRNGVLLSEDFAFVEDAASIGYKTFILPKALTFHQGSMSYPMDMGAVCTAATSLAAEQNQ